MAAFQQRLAPKVRGAVAQVLHDRHVLEVADVVNEVFLRFFSRLDELLNLDTIRKIERYCVKAAHNIAVEYSARLRQEDAIFESYESPPRMAVPPGLDEQIEEQERGQLLLRRLSELRVGLSARERRLFRMYLEGIKVEEIAEVLGEDRRVVTHDLNKVKARIHYYMRRNLLRRI